MVMQCLPFRYILSFYNNKWKSPLVLCTSKCFINKDHIISCFWFSNLRHILQLQFCHALLISKVSDILKTVFGRGPKRHCNPLSFDCFLIMFFLFHVIVFRINKHQLMAMIAFFWSNFNYWWEVYLYWTMIFLVFLLYKQ